jgi:hypothetical protein
MITAFNSYIAHAGVDNGSPRTLDDGVETSTQNGKQR